MLKLNSHPLRKRSVQLGKEGRRYLEFSHIENSCAALNLRSAHRLQWKTQCPWQDDYDQAHKRHERHIIHGPKTTLHPARYAYRSGPLISNNRNSLVSSCFFLGSAGAMILKQKLQVRDAPSTILRDIFSTEQRHESFIMHFTTGIGWPTVISSYSNPRKERRG